MSLRSRRHALWFILLALVLLTAVQGFGPAVPAQANVNEVPPIAWSASHHAPVALTHNIYLPLILGSDSPPDPCASIPTESYSAISVNPPPTDRPAEQHADLNLALRGYAPTTAFLGLVDYDGATDPGSPQFPGLFMDNRTPTFSAVYQAYNWDWSTNSRGSLITDWPVTVAGMVVAPAEPIRVPTSGYNIGTAYQRPSQGFVRDSSAPRDSLAPSTDPYEVLVLYASQERITLKFTREDNVVRGYTLHVEGVCVEPRLLALYQQWNSAGRSQLPALRAGQAFGRAKTTEFRIAIRDNGAFMDPRSRKDHWRGR